MDPEFVSIGLIFTSYLIGSIPPSYIIGKLFFKTDIRKQGSGNVGGANSIRIFGKKVGAIVAIFDIFKGTFAVLITDYYSDEATTEVGFFARSENIIALAAFAVVMGHCFSIFLKFSGGKGGATTWGILIAIDPFSFLIIIAFWIVVVLSTRFTSLGNLAMSFAIPLVLELRTDKTPFINMGYALVALLWFKHRENIGRLFRGEERKFGTKEAVVA
ncbi:MAG: Glycerol-3-phosphate acyltransferase [Candidatus Heimdallarchaeota archaeon LC_2]|nr:MAG: Glycerol-3-phosphate acyltransferase [Candidatus Heimdallarchaeota archaeon LC_2]